MCRIHGKIFQSPLKINNHKVKLLTNKLQNKVVSYDKPEMSGMRSTIEKNGFFTIKSHNNLEPNSILFSLTLSYRQSFTLYV